MYEKIAAEKDRLLKQKGQAVILAIESSCDETAAAVTCGFETLGACVHTQIDLHKKYGGVVPEIASRDHVRMLDFVVEEALLRAGKTLADIEAVAVTYGPGLVGALLCGVSFAKSLAFACGVPLYGVNHIEGHICANYLAHPDLTPPYLCLVVSGGHSHLVMVSEHGVYQLLGKTRDDAAGEAFDKAARVLGLGYPGGPQIDALAKQGDASRFTLPHPRVEGLDYSFSGLKTAMIQEAQRREKNGGFDIRDAAASFQQCVVAQLCEKAMRAARQTGAKTLAVAGGVAANSGLRDALGAACKKAGLRFCMPPVALCTDNAEMIGAAAHLVMRYRTPMDLTLNAQPSLRLPMIRIDAL